MPEQSQHDQASPAPRTTHTNVSGPSRTDIINTVQKPLGFFVLVVLVVEAIFGIVAGLSDGKDRTYLIVGMLVVILLLIAIVSTMAVFRPESLQGDRPKPPPDTGRKQEAQEVTHVAAPTVLCAASSDFEDKGFTEDIRAIKIFNSRARIEHSISSATLRGLLTTNHFHVVHLLNFVRQGNGDLVFTPEDSMPSEGFASLIEVCKAQLVILASCDSIDLAAKVSRKTNVIASTTTMKTTDFIQWAECFYELLHRGHPLSRAFDIARATTSAPVVLLMKQDVTFYKNDGTGNS